MSAQTEWLPALIEEQEGRCYWCCRRFVPRGGLLAPHLQKLLPTIDHIIPRSRGGSNLVDNLVAACSRCNHEKDNLMPDEFLRWRYGIDPTKTIRSGAYGGAEAIQCAA